jgi:hypothetical protein
VLKAHRVPKDHKVVVVLRALKVHKEHKVLLVHQV